MVRTEAIGVIPPKFANIEIKPIWRTIAKAESDKRQTRDSRSDSKWARGYLSNPHYYGFLFESAVNELLDLKGVDCRTQFDNGVDFRLWGVPIDCKSTVRMKLPAVRETEWQRHSAKIWIFGKIDDNNATIHGWMTTGDFDQWHKKANLRSGENRIPRVAEMRNIKELQSNSIGSNLLRYPGGKGTICKPILNAMDFDHGLFRPEFYVEPFVGGGSMLFQLLKGGMLDGVNIWINDLDKSLIQLYVSIRDRPQELINSIVRFMPTIDLWMQAKEQDGKIDDDVAAGFAKLVLHYCSHGGLGYVAGGPQGGNSEAKQLASKYPIGCRWNPAALIRRIRWISPLLKGARITNMSVFDMVLPSGAFVFADPPYFGAGESLYRHSFDLEKHQQLAACLSAHDGKVVLTYDDCKPIRDLYPDFNFVTFEMKTGNNHSDRKYREAVITNY